MKIYISGKISGLDPEVYLGNFARAEVELKRKGHEVINPARTNSTLPPSTTYEQYMDMSLKMLSFCDGIYLLKNWTKSPGAQTEKARAEELKLKVFYEKGENDALQTK